MPKTLSRIIAGIAAAGVALTAAQAAVYDVKIETSAGSGVFMQLGKISSFDVSTLTTAQAYKLQSASYNGGDNGLPTEVDNGAMFFLAETSDGLVLMNVFDGINDGTGGRANITWSVGGSAASSLVDDDASEAPSVVGNDFTYNFRWAGCCTDGLALGTLSRGFLLEGVFNSFTGLASLEAFGAGGQEIGLALETGRAFQISAAAVPVPAALPLAAMGFAGLFGAAKRRRKA